MNNCSQLTAVVAQGIALWAAVQDFSPADRSLAATDAREKWEGWAAAVPHLVETAKAEQFALFDRLNLTSEEVPAPAAKLSTMLQDIADTGTDDIYTDADGYEDRIRDQFEHCARLARIAQPLAALVIDMEALDKLPDASRAGDAARLRQNIREALGTIRSLVRIA